MVRLIVSSFIVSTLTIISLPLGQKDELFVRDDEKLHETRTPRPDLGDRPYAFDYSGESFRKIFNVSISEAYAPSFL